MAISKYWTILTVYFIVHGTQLQNDFIQTEEFSRIEKSLVELCPKVDICNRNSSEPNVMQNGLIGIQTVSCCQGCSCHERCHENMNCCFPNDNIETADAGRSSVVECLYIRTGTPAETWPKYFPAYRIVSSAPKRGCIRDGVGPSCDEDQVAVWGNLSPVYSKEHDIIFKNAHCALCHNTTEVIPWLPELVCIENPSRARIRNSHHAQFLEDNLRKSNCYIEFHFNGDPSLLSNKRCYHEMISTCKLPSQNGTTSTTDIQEACESGLMSPVRQYRAIYRNIYCLFCNDDTKSINTPVVCPIGEKPRAPLSGKLSVLLDVEFLKKMNHNGVSGEKIEFPKACVMNDQSMTSERCRDIICPAGQIRSHTGCKVPSNAWFAGLVLLTLQLTYPENQYDNITTQFQLGLVKQVDIKQRFLENTPWHSLWKLVLIEPIEESHPERSVLISLVTETNSPTFLFRSIKNSIGKVWTVSLNGYSVNFEQSFYKKVNDYWNSEVLYKERPSTIPQALTKLFVCEQVFLYSGEFYVTERNHVLISNLTVRNLYEMEFELVYDSKSVTVCLSDTVFKTTHDTGGSQKELLALSTILFVMALYLLIC